VRSSPACRIGKSASSKKTEDSGLDGLFKEEIAALTVEAKALFNVLDSSSKRIRELESSLSELKAHFPFHVPLPESSSLDMEGPWFLAWDLDDNSQKFRLLLIGSVSTGSSAAEDIRKPLIEADLATRLRFSEYLSTFIRCFKKHLHDHRIAIEGKGHSSSAWEAISLPNCHRSSLDNSGRFLSKTSYVDKPIKWRVWNSSFSPNCIDSKIGAFSPEGSGRKTSSFAEEKPGDFSAIPDTPPVKNAPKKISPVFCKEAEKS
jgi:hypothetical protein